MSDGRQRITGPLKLPCRRREDFERTHQSHALDVPITETGANPASLHHRADAQRGGEPAAADPGALAAAPAGAGWAYEVLVVDDTSHDHTDRVCAELARRYPVPLIVRQPENGLSGAVLDGLSAARGEYLVIMDADLQHPPESLPGLLAPLANGEADFTIGSALRAGWNHRGGVVVLRRVYSRVATLLAKPIAGDTHDPMSGFFALRRETFERARHLTPLGYKIGLELMCKCGVARERVREVPIHFATRHAGRSKLGLKQQFKYLEHLSRLYDFFFPAYRPS